MWRVRTTLPDRPGLLARIATACGGAGVNIVAMQVFRTTEGAVDELVVDASDDWTDAALADLLRSAGGTDVSVVRADEDSLADAPTRYLQAVHEVIEEGRDVEDVLAELLQTTSESADGTTTPATDPAYAGHDVLDLSRRDGTVLRLSRPVPFTRVERARAQAFLSLVSDAGVDIPLITPSPHHPLPLVREATLADIEAVSALHGRCSVATLYQRYQVPLRLPMTTRFARRLVLPEAGEALVVQMGLAIVGHGLLERVEDGWTFQLIVEDAWQGRHLDTMLVREAAARARALGAQHLTFQAADTDDTLLRAVGAAGLVARVERRDGAIHVTAPLGSLRGAESA